MPRIAHWLALISLLTTCLSTAHAQENEVAAALLFNSNEILSVRIVAPFDTMAENRLDDELRGQFYYTASDGEQVELDIGIRLRGKYRRRPDVCSFPPVRLNFKKSQVKDTILDGNDKLKLVTHCNTGSFVFEQVILTEYLVYRILNLVTDISFRVRLLQVDYADSDVDNAFQAYGVLIEHKDVLAERIETPIRTVDKVPLSELDAEHVNLTSVFQYLIGNTDFASTSGPVGEECCHNATLFGDDDGPSYSIPYDFDMSGFVNAPYATPNPQLRLDSVQERLYRGFCANNERLPATLEVFRAKREEIEALVRDEVDLSTRKRRELLSYIDAFYRSVSNDRGVNRNLIRKCR
jgi:hypothetical protein